MKVRECVLIEPFTCNHTDNLVDVAKKLRSKTLRHIFVVDNQAPVGVISITDMNNRVVAEGKDPKQLTAQDIMTKDIEVVSCDDLAGDVARAMVKKNHVLKPVVEDNKMIGMLPLDQALRGIKQ